MANVDSPKGLKVAGPLLGCHLYECSATYATSFFIGDPVVLTGTSNQITTATAGSTNILLGAVIGIYDSNKLPGWQASTGERLNYKPGSSLGKAYILVADHPQQVFIAQGDGDTSYLDANDQGGNISLVAASTGGEISGISQWELDDSNTGGAGTTEQIRLIRPVDRPDNLVGIANCDWYCMINYHQRNAGAVGAGI
jgi:hypothetical protein